VAIRFFPPTHFQSRAPAAMNSPGRVATTAPVVSSHAVTGACAESAAHAR
jgi:hypothetical protein